MTINTCLEKHGLEHIFAVIWHDKAVPQEFKDASVVKKKEEEEGWEEKKETEEEEERFSRAFN